MLADAVVSLGYILLCPVLVHGRDLIRDAWNGVLRAGDLASSVGYTPISESDAPSSSTHLDPQVLPLTSTTTDEIELDVSPEHLISNRNVTIGLIASIVFCVVSIRIVFGNLVPIYAIVSDLFASPPSPQPPSHCRLQFRQRAASELLI